MCRTKKRERHGRPWHRYAVEVGSVARKAGLWLLEDGTPEKPRWTFFCAQTGSEVLKYWPHTRFYTTAHDAGRCRWRASVELAKKLHRIVPARQ